MQPQLPFEPNVNIDDHLPVMFAKLKEALFTYVDADNNSEHPHTILNKEEKKKMNDLLKQLQ